MTDEILQSTPPLFSVVKKATKAIGFTMASDIFTCSLLRTLAASKPSGKLLELGTGTGLSTCWILDGMSPDARLTSLDNNDSYLAVAQGILGQDKRLTLVHTDGEEWIVNNKDQKFDYIFADTWHGKYLLLDEVLSMLNPGGFYIVDDMLRQPNWPEGHEEKVEKLVAHIESRSDLLVTKQVWSTGVIVAVKK